jgi:hypothetical protein
VLPKGKIEINQFRAAPLEIADTVTIHTVPILFFGAPSVFMDNISVQDDRFVFNLVWISSVLRRDNFVVILIKIASFEIGVFKDAMKI